MKPISSLSQARRQSFVLGQGAKTKTAKSQLATLKPTSLEDLENAFSLEPVTKEFYNGYNALYERITSLLSSEQSCLNALQGYENLTGEKAIKAFVKKLLGRIVFLYFLQKKGWLGVERDGAWGSGDKEFLTTLFKRAKSEGKSFYESYLSPLFFESLNTKREGDYSPYFDCKIPFLNGGLFEESFRVGSPKDSKTSLDRSLPLIDILDNALFAEIFDFFELYNFTIEESAPNDVEISIDPEMLGKIFENLIDYNHSTGAYYTPRGIVHFMCKNALIYSLSAKFSENSSFSFRHSPHISEAGNQCEGFSKFPEARTPSSLTPENLAKTTHSHTANTRICGDSDTESRASSESSIDSIQGFAHSNRFSVQNAPLKSGVGGLGGVSFYPPTHYNGSDLRVCCEATDPHLHIQAPCPPLQQNTQDSKKSENICENEILRNENLKSEQTQNLTHDISNNIKDALFELIYHHNIDNPLIRTHAKALQSHLKALKILDPAIGSGAFPMGLLSEILNLHALLHRAITGEELSAKERAGLKREIIAHQIYGVDIDCDAIEIARLRFWLSIAVDEDTPSPLPNLDFKFMQGNSLLEQLCGIDIIPHDFDSARTTPQRNLLSEVDIDASLFDTTQAQKLAHLFESYYTQSDHKNKEKLKSKILKLMKKAFDTRIEQVEAQIIANQNYTKGQSSDRAKQQEQILRLSEFKQALQKLYDDYASKNFHTDKLFLYRFFFAPVFESGGFDIVIGNPPYIRQEEIKNKKHILAEFRSFGNASADIFTYFFAKGLEVLKPKGILSLITSNKYARAGYGKNLRKMLLQHTLLSYYDFNGIKAFATASVDTSITTITNAPKPKDSTLEYIEFSKYQGHTPC